MIFETINIIKGWASAAKVYGDRRIIQIFFLGFVSGLPLPLTMGTLSLWMAEAGVDKTTIGIFALVGLPYTLKFLWSPLIDMLRLPILGKLLGRRRSWILFTQGLLALSLIGLGSSNPVAAPLATAWWAFLVTFSSASQDIVIDAYRVEILDKKSYGAGAASVVFGYRIGMLVSGAGALYMASFGSWSTVYTVMAALIVIGSIAVLVGNEPQLIENAGKHNKANWIKNAVVDPFSDFLKRKDWVAILLFIAFYKLGDAFLNNMMNPFFVEAGFSKIEIANVTKVFGLVATLVGAFVGGVIVSRFGIMRALLFCSVIHMSFNLIFVVQAWVGHDLSLLIATITAENITNGMATTALVAYLSSLCHQEYTATQYALLSSFSATGRSILSSSAGALAQALGWPAFFLATSLIALPGIFLLLWIMRSGKKEVLGEEKNLLNIS